VNQQFSDAFGNCVCSKQHEKLIAVILNYHGDAEIYNFKINFSQNRPG